MIRRTSLPHLLLLNIRHRWRRLLVLLSLLYLLQKFNYQKHPFTPKPHTITSLSLDYERTHLSPTSPHREFRPTSEASALCHAHNWRPWPYRGTGPHKRKVYDLFMLNDELDWLEIRLHTLAPYVDYFVILESPFTFTKQAKPLVLKENWDKFKQWHDMIIYKEVAGMPVGAKRTWDLEDYQRNSMLLQGIASVEGTEHAARWGDVLLISDVDEIPRPISVVLLRECETQKRVTLRSVFYYYGFQYKHMGREWSHPQATIYQGTKTILPADLRNGEGRKVDFFWTWWDKAELWNGGWHCSTCFKTVEEVLSKLRSFSHVGMNQEPFRDRGRIVDRVRKGLDLWDRKGEIYEEVHANEDIPEYLKKDRQRWAFLLDRSGSNAAFQDYDAGEAVGD
ncbi:glycosyltransferase family 17 protein [Stipitochalara longipes BDJ]|nr:glycosyltransferase family 17 protein [Stipitochalara longipes BDJ]